MRIRHIEDNDWDSVVALEAQAYANGLSEDRSALSSKNRVSPSTCFVLEGECIAGYLLALPYPRLRYPALAQAERVAYSSANVHLHDLVIAKQFRGRGLAKQLLQRLMDAARAKRYDSISLIAVAGSEPFWRHQGYRRCPDVALPANYGADAVYMSRSV